MLNLNADLFRIVARYASTEATRYYLGGVHVEAHPCGGVYMVATDGHRMMVAYDKDGATDRPRIVAIDKALLKACGRTRAESRWDREGDNPRRIIIGTDTLRVMTARGECTGRRGYENQYGAPVEVYSAPAAFIDGTFPDWRRVVPAAPDEPVALGAVNPAYLSGFADDANAMVEALHGHETLTTVRPVATSSDGPILMLFGNNVPAFGVLMPVRGACTVPAFFNAKPFDVARVTLSKLEPVSYTDTRGPHTFTVTRQVSDLHEPVTTRHRFETHAASVRAFNRVRANLAAAGVVGLPEHIGPHIPMTWAEKVELERRASAMKAARETFETASETDLAFPWRRNLIPLTAEKVTYYRRKEIRTTVPVDLSTALRSLKAVSEGAIIASAYRMAA